MTLDLKRELLRHLLATVVYRANAAISNAPENFFAFRIDESIRTPGEILAHIGDLLEGSLRLMKGEFVHLTCTRKITPSEWRESTKIKIGDSSDEKDFYRRADRRDSARV